MVPGCGVRVGVNAEVGDGEDVKVAVVVDVVVLVGTGVNVKGVFVVDVVVFVVTGAGVVVDSGFNVAVSNTILVSVLVGARVDAGPQETKTTVRMIITSVFVFIYSP